MKNWAATVCDLDECWEVYYTGDYEKFMEIIDDYGLDVEDVWEEE